MKPVLLYDITKRCNLKCTHCYNAGYYAQITNDLNIFPVLKFIKANDIEHVHILGGEPFCAEHLFEFIHSLKNQTVSINTNGTLLDKKQIDQVIQNENITQLTISLDGHDAATNDAIRGIGVFQRICENISNLNEERANKHSNLSLNLAFVATPENLASLHYLAELTEILAVDCLMVSFLYYEGNARVLKKKYDFNMVVECLVSLFEKMLKVRAQLLIDIKPNLAMLVELMSSVVDNIPKKTSPCYANNGYFYIDANHKLYPCSPCAKTDSDLYMLCDLKLDDYVVKDKKHLETAKSKPSICSRCLAHDLCNPCPINCSTCISDFCEEANAYIKHKINAVITKKIDKSNEYKLIVYNKKLLLVNFKKHQTIVLCDCVQMDNQEYPFVGWTIASIIKKLPENKKDDFLFRITNAVKKGLLYVS